MFLRKRYYWIFYLLLILGITFIFLSNNYLLNRTVREISMRLVQIEILSSKTAVDYKVSFYKDHYEVKVYNNINDLWEIYTRDFYPKGIITDSLPVEFYFSRGRFREYQFKDRNRKTPKSMILYFSYKGSEKKRALIFFKDNDWKVLG